MARKTLSETKAAIESRLAGLNLGWGICYANDENANVEDGEFFPPQFIKIGQFSWSRERKGHGVEERSNIVLHGTVMIAVYDKVGVGQEAMLNILESIENAFSNTSADGIRYMATYSTSAPTMRKHDGLAIIIEWRVD